VRRFGLRSELHQGPKHTRPLRPPSLPPFSLRKILVHTVHCAARAFASICLYVPCFFRAGTFCVWAVLVWCFSFCYWVRLTTPPPLTPPPPIANISLSNLRVLHHLNLYARAQPKHKA